MITAIATFLAQVPEPPVNAGQSPLAGYAIMAIGAALVIGISLMPSKRSHQD